MDDLEEEESASCFGFIRLILIHLTVEELEASPYFVQEMFTILCSRRRNELKIYRELWKCLKAIESDPKKIGVAQKGIDDGLGELVSRRFLTEEQKNWITEKMRRTFRSEVCTSSLTNS